MMCVSPFKTWNGTTGIIFCISFQEFGKVLLQETICFLRVDKFYLASVPSHQNQNCLLVIRPRTIIHQDLCLGKLVPSPHKRSKLSNGIYCTLRSRDKGIGHKVPISYSLGEETGLVISRA